MAADLARMREWLEAVLEKRALSTDEARELLVGLTDVELPPALAGAFWRLRRVRTQHAGRP